MNDKPTNLTPPRAGATETAEVPVVVDRDGFHERGIRSAG